MPKVRVPQADGEISVFPGDYKWDVKNHMVDVKEEDLELFLRGVEGKVVESKSDSDIKKEA